MIYLICDRRTHIVVAAYRYPVDAAKHLEADRGVYQNTVPIQEFFKGVGDS